MKQISIDLIVCLFHDAFHERVKVYQHWQHSQMMLTKKREQKTKIELTGRTEKLEPASNEVIEVRGKNN